MGEAAEDQPAAERGATLVLVALVMVVLMGMAGFAIDLGFLYWQATETQKAAEAAALAGVAHMPAPVGIPWAASEAHDVAIDIAERAGYRNFGTTVVTPREVVNEDYQLNVEIQTEAPTYFMKVFGVHSVSITRDATAESLPPLRLGSDQAFLGEDPECDTDPTCPNGTRDTDLWLATNGDRTPKGQGDPFTSECYGPNPGSCSGNNFEFRAPSYWYAVDVPATEAGKTLQVQLYDPGNKPGGVALDRELAPGSVHNLDWQVRLLEPDQTPSNPLDNSSVVCTAQFRNRNHGSYDPATSDAWVDLCGPQVAESGLYVVEITASGDVDLLNAFSLRARVNGSADANVAVFGLGAMSIWTPESNSSPTFQLVRLDPVYAGTQLIVELWDPGDLEESGDIEFLGSLGGVECLVRIRDDRGGVVEDWHADDGGAGCRVHVDYREHNNEWVDFMFDIPPDHTCSGSACWSSVRYDFNGSTTDRTTWAARINGGPIHLLP